MGKKLAERLYGWLRMASQLGCTLRECLLRVDHPEFLLWEAFWDMELEEPSIDQQYLLRLAQVIQHSNGIKPSTFSQLRIPHTPLLERLKKARETAHEEQRAIVQHSRAEASRLAWMGIAKTWTNEMDSGKIRGKRIGA